MAIRYSNLKKHEIGKSYFPDLSGFSADIFNRLRKCPKRFQKNVFNRLYSDFPGGKQLARTIYKINNMPWLIATSLNDGQRERIKHDWTTHMARLGAFYKKKIRGYKGWNAAKCAAYDALWSALDTARESAFHVAENAAKYATGAVYNAIQSAPSIPYVHGKGLVKQLVTRRVVCDAIFCAGWCVMNDLERFKFNPFESLLDIYDEGVLIENYKEKPAILTKTGFDLQLID